MARDYDSEEERPSSEYSAKYANYFKVTSSLMELTMHFGQFFTEDSSPTVHTRIVTSPAFGRAFLGLLSKSVHDLDNGAEKSDAEEVAE
jgi:hypothetical protein